ncbi:MAG: response regulator receiver protein, partial [Acidobacteriota bacterium]
MKILLVDAGHAELSELAKQLRSAARVQVASGGLFALTLLERERPDAVLTRAHVGDMSGAELCGLVKKD